MQATKKKLRDQIEESNWLADSLDNLEQYTRKNSVELHCIPENTYDSTEVVVKVAKDPRA